MNCPIDGTELKITDRQGIEIDYCPQCRGVWLDRGELDKIIERTVGELTQPSPYVEQKRYDDNDHSEKRKRKRASFLGDLFDF